MKVISWISALYMMALFLMPCADTYEMYVYHKMHSAEDLTSHADDHSGPMDLCSPFCKCNCCGVLSNVYGQWTTPDISKVTLPEYSKPKTYQKPLFIPTYIGEIWQPPKILD